MSKSFNNENLSSEYEMKIGRTTFKIHSYYQGSESIEEKIKKMILDEVEKTFEKQNDSNKEAATK